MHMRLPILSTLLTLPLVIIAILGMYGLITLAALTGELRGAVRDLEQVTVQHGVPFVTRMKMYAEHNSEHDESRIADAPDDAPRMHGAIMGAYQHANIDERLAAIEELGDTRDPLAAMTLRSLLDDSSVAIRKEAIESLGAVGGSDSVAGLAYSLSDPDAVVRRIAIETLASLDGDDATGALAWTLHDRDPELRILAIEELADRGDESAYILMQRFASDEHPQVRDIAMQELAALERPFDPRR